MLDLRTLLVLMAVADLMLAAALWIGASRGLRDGLSQWASSLAVRALALGIFALAGSAQSGGIAVGGALLALSITLQGAALLAFDRRPFPAWLHSAVVAAIAVPLQLLERDAAIAVLFGGVVFGSLLLVVAAFAWHLRALPRSRARQIVLGAYVAAGGSFMLRGVGAMVSADPMRGFDAPSGFAAATFITCFAASLAATLGFLLLQKERADGEAARLANVDPLTGAINRRTFHETAERELSRARRAGTPLSMILLDIDHFRAVNDQHGHVVGDEVLARIADVIRSAMRKEDMLVRFGGEEFLVMLPDVPGPGAVIVAGRIRRTVAGAEIEVGGRKFFLTVSLGVAARLDEGPESADGLIARADSALALAKQRGRNRVVALSLGRSIAA
ncbi:MAG TPA: GGDEF domain-containing protein [Usitatibacter sp.]|nr:GGDEF domain-containing protein [Usitatibacter sp.]